MLLQRVITAVALLLVLVPAMVWRGTWPFALVTAAMMGAAAWEWACLNGLRQAAAMTVGGALALVLVAAWARVGDVPVPATVWWAVTAGWTLLLAAVLRGGVEAWPRWPAALRLVVGWAALAAAWWALVGLHAQGFGVLLSALALVWVTDVAAYFAGRAFGRHKLAPRISPGKTWEGAVGGCLAVLTLALAWTAIAGIWPPAGDALYPRLLAHGLAVALPALCVLTAASVAGDLFESLVKRSAGVKDSSALLPGHGGVLDRVDALLPVLPAAMALLSGAI